MEMKESFDSYVVEDDEEEIGPHYTMWSIVPQSMFMPSRAWNKARTAGPQHEIATIRFLLPVCLAAAGADFISLLYPGQHSITGIVVGAVVTFIAFFLGYYLALVISKIFLPREAKDFPSSNYGKLVTMGGISTLALFHILSKALPMFDFFIEFLPLWTIYILYEAMKRAGIQSERYIFAVGVVCIAVICAPILVEWLMILFI